MAFFPSSGCAACDAIPKLSIFIISLLLESFILFLLGKFILEFVMLFNVIEQYLGTTFNAFPWQSILRISKFFILNLFFNSKDKIPFSAYIPGKFASGLNPIIGHSSCDL